MIDVQPWSSRARPGTGARGHATAQEATFLRGPTTRSSELWRAFRIFSEFIRGFRALHFIGPCVTVFGSARFDESHPYYRLARELGSELARTGFTVMTGGGPGIMEAANRGARDVGGRIDSAATSSYPLSRSPTLISISGSSFSISSYAK